MASGNPIDTSFYTYLIYLILGLALITLLPEQYRVMMIAILILGGFAAIGSNLTDLGNILSGQIITTVNSNTGNSSTGTVGIGA